jgi:hypothetical protein
VLSGDAERAREQHYVGIEERISGAAAADPAEQSCRWRGDTLGAAGHRGRGVRALTTAQVKLGRRDARLLIDLSTVMLNHVRDYLPDDLTKEVDRRLGGLRLGQVFAENEAARKAEAEANDLDRIPSPPPTHVGSGR